MLKTVDKYGFKLFSNVLSTVTSKSKSFFPVPVLLYHMTACEMVKVLRPKPSCRFDTDKENGNRS